MNAVHNAVGIEDLYVQMKVSDATKSTLCVLGDPGTGKTSIRRQTALEWLRRQGAPETNYIYVNAATKTAEFFGMSVPIIANNSCDFFVAEWFRRINDLGPAIICYDEFDKLGFRDQTPFLQAITERAVDNVRLHDNVVQTVLGNFRTNGNGSQGVSNIVTNRCRTVHFRPEDHRVHAYLVAIGCHPWVTSFLLGNPNRTNDFRPDRERNCTSRQWEGVSKDLYALQEMFPEPSSKHVVQTVASRVPDDVAQEFAIMTELQQVLVPFDVVMADPLNAPMPKSEDRGVHWLQVNTIASRAAGMKLKEKRNGMSRTACKTAAYQYAERFAPEFLNAIIPMITMPAIDDPVHGGKDVQMVPPQLHGDSAKILLDKLSQNRRIVEEG